MLSKISPPGKIVNTKNDCRFSLGTNVLLYHCFFNYGGELRIRFQN